MPVLPGFAQGQAGLKEKLDTIEQELDRNRSEREQAGESAEQTEAELHQIKLKGVALAGELHRREEEILRLEDQIATLERDEREKAEDFGRRRADLAATLAALQRIARMPATTLLAVPRPPDETIRSAILLRAAVPELQREAEELGREVAELAELRARIGEERTALGEAVAGLEAERRKLDAATEQKTALLEQSRSAERKAAADIAKLSAKAGDMRELLERLSRQNRAPALRAPDFEPPPEPAEKPDPPPIRARDNRKETQTASLPAAPRPSPPQRLPTPDGMPAPGRIETAFGAPMANGVTSKGVWIATRPGTAVVAPQRGRVVFAGHFRGYGNLVILQVAEKGHALISGMTRITATVGDDVLAGEPIGEMTPSTDAAPKLYFELRRRGQPVNPLPPQAAHRNKVSG